MNSGDQNTKFFFRAIQTLHGRSRIVSISNEDGFTIDDPAEVSEFIVNYFQRLLRVHMSTMWLICAELSKEVSEEVIRSVLFSFKSNRAPGPDGFSAQFFKKAWNIVGWDVIVVVKSFSVFGRLLKKVNTIAIALLG